MKPPEPEDPHKIKAERDALLTARECTRSRRAEAELTRQLLLTTELARKDRLHREEYLMSLDFKHSDSKAQDSFIKILGWTS